MARIGVDDEFTADQRAVFTDNAPVKIPARSFARIADAVAVRIVSHVEYHAYVIFAVECETDQHLSPLDAAVAADYASHERAAGADLLRERIRNRAIDSAIGPADDVVRAVEVDQHRVVAGFLTGVDRDFLPQCAGRADESAAHLVILRILLPDDEEIRAVETHAAAIAITLTDAEFAAQGAIRCNDAPGDVAIVRVVAVGRNDEPGIREQILAATVGQHIRSIERDARRRHGEGWSHLRARRVDECPINRERRPAILDSLILFPCDEVIDAVEGDAGSAAGLSVMAQSDRRADLGAAGRHQLGGDFGGRGVAFQRHEKISAIGRGAHARPAGGNRKLGADDRLRAYRRRNRRQHRR